MRYKQPPLPLKIPISGLLERTFHLILPGKRQKPLSAPLKIRAGLLTGIRQIGLDAPGFEIVNTPVSGGLGLEFWPSSNWFFGVNTQYYQFYYKLEHLDRFNWPAEELAFFPGINQPEPISGLYNITSKSHIIENQFYAGYSMDQLEKWKPFAKIGIGNMLYLSQTFRYDFEENNQYVMRNGEGEQMKMQLDHYFISLGLIHPLGKRLFGRGEVNYLNSLIPVGTENRNMKPTVLRVFDLVGVEVGKEGDLGTNEN